MTLEEFQPGEPIFFEQDIDYNFYIIEEGEVQIYIKDGAGKRVNLANLGPGETFGEFAMLDRTPRSASAQALTYSKIYRISEDGYQQLLTELPVWTQAVLKSFAARIRKMNDIIKEQNELVEKIRSYEFLLNEDV